MWTNYLTATGSSLSSSWLYELSNVLFLILIDVSSGWFPVTPTRGLQQLHICCLHHFLFVLCSHLFLLLYDTTLCLFICPDNLAWKITRQPQLQWPNKRQIWFFSGCICWFSCYHLNSIPSWVFFTDAFDILFTRSCLDFFTSICPFSPDSSQSSSSLLQRLFTLNL